MPHPRLQVDVVLEADAARADQLVAALRARLNGRAVHAEEAASRFRLDDGRDRVAFDVRFANGAGADRDAVLAAVRAQLETPQFRGALVSAVATRHECSHDDVDRRPCVAEEAWRL